MSEPSDGVGSLAEEALKLLGALSGLAREHGPDQQYDLDGTGPAHVDDCTYCPVCRAIHYVREISPEVREHLAAASASLIQAAAALLATAPPSDSGADTGPGERIDLDGDLPVEDSYLDEGTS